MVKNILKIVGILILGMFIFLSYDMFTHNGVKSYYCLSEDEYITVWHNPKGNGDVYIIFGKYESNNSPHQNYIKTSYNNAITIIIDDTSEYEYVISNDYGKEIIINELENNVKLFDYYEYNFFVEKYYENNIIKENVKYIKIDFKEDLVVVNGVKK